VYKGERVSDCCLMPQFKEKFEDTKGVIGSINQRRAYNRKAKRTHILQKIQD
jgi:hypothetical protein